MTLSTSNTNGSTSSAANANATSNSLHAIATATTRRRASSVGCLSPTTGATTSNTVPVVVVPPPVSLLNASSRTSSNSTLIPSSSSSSNDLLSTSSSSLTNSTCSSSSSFSSSTSSSARSSIFAEKAASLKASLEKGRRKPTCLEDVAANMREMDLINNTTFSNWIRVKRSETNLDYLCTYKGPMILDFINEDSQSAMHSLEWLIQEWETESVAELILKLFYQYRVASQVFSDRVFSLTHDWSTERILEILPVLLIGENPRVCASFFSSWFIASGWSEERLTDIASPIISSFKWTPDQISEFLLETIILVVRDSMLQRSMALVVSEEMELGQTKMLLGRRKKVDLNDEFELLYQLIYENRERKNFTASSDNFLSRDDEDYLLSLHEE